MTSTDITARRIPTLRQAGSNPMLKTIARAATMTGERFVFASYAKWNISREVPTTDGYYHFTADGRIVKVEG